MTSFRIPTDWTTEQALIVLDLLEDLYRAVWDGYENPVVEAIIRQLDEPDHVHDVHLSPDDENGDIPF